MVPPSVVLHMNNSDRYSGRIVVVASLHVMLVTGVCKTHDLSLGVVIWSF